MVVQGQRAGSRKRWPILRPCVFFALLLAGLCGCRTNQKSALTEAELRTRDREVRQLQTDLHRAEAMNSAMTRELTDRRNCPTPPYPPSTSVDGPAAMMSGMVREVLLGRGTGGVDDDGWPGDEALQIVLVPQDVDRHAVKVPGSLVVIVFEITSDGLKVPLDRWDIPALQLQRNWRSGLFSTGYYVLLPWKRWPASERLRVVAQFTTLPDGRVLESDRDVKIKLMPGGPRGVPANGPPGMLVVPPPPKVEGPVLPPTGSLRDPQPPAASLEAAKPALGGFFRQPARLLGPEMKNDPLQDPP
jgi:hypothetical protein